MLDNHYIPNDYGLIRYFTIFGKQIPTYTFFVLLGLFVGIIWFMFTVSFKDKVRGDKAYLMVLSALIFGFIGSKVLVIIENIGILLKDFSQIKAFVFTGKSIIGGLIGGYIGIKLSKRILKMKEMRLGNKIAPAIALGMGIGRIGCFLTGCCAGIKTNLKIGVDFGDGVNRIPTQLIEMIFCFILFIYLFYKQKNDENLLPGILFQKLVLYYFIFRFFIEFIRATEKNILFLSIYQLISIIGIIYIIFKMRKERKGCGWKQNRISELS